MRSTERKAPPSVLARAVSLLDAFDPTEPILTLAALSRSSGLPRSTAHRMCGELVELGLLEHVEGGYRLGMRLFELGAAVPRGLDLREAARPHMEDLRLASGGRSVHLAVLEGTEVVYIEILRAVHGPRLPSRVGGRLPAHATGVGKAILAFSPPEVVAARVEAGLTRLTPRTICQPGTLARELAGIRSTGIALDREESTMGLLCAAAPVFGVGERVVAALSLSGLSARNMSSMAPAVRTAATSLSRALGAFLD